MNAAKKRLIRKHILELSRELYLHPITDRAITENIKERHPNLTKACVREHIHYLAAKDMAVLHKKKNTQSIGITTRGIDVLDGAINVRGVEPSDSQSTRLSYKKELRRGILLYCNSFKESYNEDSEIHAEFRASGFKNLILEEIRFHTWYLEQKKFLEVKSYSAVGGLIFLARITADGIDLLENTITDAGVSNDDD